MASPLSSGFHIADGNGYMLESDYAAACRLNLQVYLWKKSLKFTLHPSIPLLPDNVSPRALRIADIATGTALWLLDLSEELPPLSAQLDGFDIDLSKAPNSKWLPTNICLGQWNIFDPVPDHMLGRYDVVHLRLLILVVQDSDPLPIMRNVYRMLKPGGYIQWDELNYPDTHVVKVNPGTKTPAFDKLLEFVYSNGRHDWVFQLPDILLNNGFTEARLESYTDRMDLVMANGQQHLMTMAEFMGTLAKRGLLEEAQDMDKLLRGVAYEATQGVALAMPKVVCVAKKI
ncbi:hypothetical protein AbraIFM66951_008159 [Aspergillus brasiliensis]|nr:hypothetical protein AbraIFM66951_008159 [Aspergillus brasiliensis]